MLKLCLAAAALCATPLLAQNDAIPTYEAQQLPSLVATYKQIHAHPELSHYEEATSALLAGELSKAGFTVTDHVGIYPDGSHAYGVVAIL